jgi:hypothetical protein
LIWACFNSSLISSDEFSIAEEIPPSNQSVSIGFGLKKKKFYFQENISIE